LKELVDKHRDELLSYGNVKKDKADFTEQEVWDWVKKHAIKQQERAKRQGLNINEIY
jgi:hypothetical protein